MKVVGDVHSNLASAASLDEGGCGRKWTKLWTSSRSLNCRVTQFRRCPARKRFELSERQGCQCCLANVKCCWSTRTTKR